MHLGTMETTSDEFKSGLDPIDRQSSLLTMACLEWVVHMLTYPRHLLVTCFVRASEQLGLFRPHHPLYKVFVTAVEFVGII